jgi:dihydrofolate reductase
MQLEPACGCGLPVDVEHAMTLITAPHSMSLDGFIDNPRVHDWLRDGDTPSQLNPAFTMSAASARFFDEGVGRTGAVIAGRRTYDVSDAWGGRGPMPGLPLFVVTHHIPETVRPGEPPYTFVTTGIEAAVEKARAAAAGKDVVLMGASIVRQCLRAGLLDELVISVVPLILGIGVRLLDDLLSGNVELSLTQVIDAADVTHLTYRVVR